MTEWLDLDLYEIHLTHQPPDSKHRKPERVFAAARSAEQAMSACREQFPEGTQFNSIEKRSRWDQFVICREAHNA